MRKYATHQSAWKIPAHSMGGRLIASVVLAGAVSAALGQATMRAAFVANNGNLEGSVSSFTFDPTGVPVFNDIVITGQRPNTTVYEPGCNAYAISITPNGRFLATGHASSDDPIQQITVLEVAADATLTMRSEYPAPDTPIDLAWISDQYLAALRTELGQVNQVIVYELDPVTGTLTEVDRGDCGTFTTSVWVHPSRELLYAADSLLNRIYPFAIAADGTLTGLTSTATGSTYPLGICGSPDGTKLYANSGISSGGNKILGYFIEADGLLTAMPTMPFTTPGASPKDCAFSVDSGILFVSHGTDSTVRSFLVDQETGGLTYTGTMFDVGLQGSLGDHAVLGDYLLVTDNTTALDGVKGLYSFDILPGGGLSMNGTIVDTNGIGPREIATWIPPCPADLTGDGAVNLADLAVLLAAYGTCDGDPGYVPIADFDDSGCIELADLATLLGAYGDCP